MGSLRNDESETISVIMLPLPAQGHLNQMLQLSCYISSYGIPVHFVGSPIFNRQVKARFHGLRLNSNVHFQDFPVPPYQAPPPVADAVKKFPAHIQPGWESAMHMADPFNEFLRTQALKNSRVVVIYDPILASLAKEVASIPNAESYEFVGISAYCQIKFLYEMTGKTCPVEALRKLPPISSTISEGLGDFIGLQIDSWGLGSGYIMNTCRMIEGPFLDFLENNEIKRDLKNWAIGPMAPAPAAEEELQSRHEILQWLDTQPARSVILVTFGSTTTLTDGEVAALAAGLERSGQRFVWVVREADTANIFDGEARRVALPAGFEERVRERGMVVREWAPQPAILAHPATGGFMSHCGWNSCCESMMTGVPMAAWPMHSDQPVNAALVTEILKVGLFMGKWGEEMTAEVVEDVVRRLISTKEGGEVRKRAEEVAAVLREATGEGGVSRLEMDSFIAHITRKDV